MPNLAFLSLGSNIRPEENLSKAVEMLAHTSRLVAVSTVWETLPLGITDQPNFLNAATLVETDHTANAFKSEVIRRIEDELGRVRKGDKFGPRPIDIDIMLFNDQIFELDNHHIPDPELLIRTSGERRISNFLLWQLAYTELYFTPVLWPDYRKEHFYEAIIDYQRRERRFGKVSGKTRAVTLNN